MSDRLKDLQRQRALAQEQLAWLDREIARESGAVALPLAPPVSVPPATVPADVTAEADRIIKQYQAPRPIQDQVKRGCFMYFFAAFALVGLGLVALYFYGHH